MKKLYVTIKNREYAFDSMSELAGLLLKVLHSQKRVCQFYWHDNFLRNCDLLHYQKHHYVPGYTWMGIIFIPSMLVCKLDNGAVVCSGMALMRYFQKCFKSQKLNASLARKLLDSFLSYLQDMRVKLDSLCDTIDELIKVPSGSRTCDETLLLSLAYSFRSSHRAWVRTRTH